MDNNIGMIVWACALIGVIALLIFLIVEVRPEAKPSTDSPKQWKSSGGEKIGHMVTKRTDCPLLEVKRLHGQLIDKDEFLKDMRKLYEEKQWEEKDVHFSLFDLEMNLMGRAVIGTEGEDD